MKCSAKPTTAPKVIGKIIRKDKMTLEEKKYDLVKIAESYFQAAKNNTLELNKITASFFGYIFTISTFFLGFTIALHNMLGGLNKFGILFLIISVILGITTIIISILNILYNRQDMNYIIDLYLDLNKKCYTHINKNDRFVDVIPDELIFENIYKHQPKKIMKFALYAFFGQIISTILILFTKIDFNIVIK